MIIEVISIGRASVSILITIFSKDSGFDHLESLIVVTSFYR